MIEGKDLIQIGYLYKPHGFKGEINASFDFDPDIFRDSDMPFIMKIDGIFVPFFLDQIRGKGENCIVKFEDLDSDKAVSILVNHEIFALKEQLAEVAGVSMEEMEDTLYIEGYQVVDAASGDLIGIVNDVEEGKEYDYLLIEADGVTDIRIPFVDSFIVDVEASEGGKPGVIRVDLPEGLVDLN